MPATRRASRSRRIRAGSRTRWSSVARTRTARSTIAAAREAIVAGLEAGRDRFGFALACDATLRAALVDDLSGDRLDAVLCLVQAAIASRRDHYGLPDDVDPVEGWIVAD
jgi:hypothetical protein